MEEKDRSKMRSLYQCSHAKVNGEEILCDAGYSLGANKDGSYSVLRLMRGAPLILAHCQTCVDFDSMGDPVAKEDRGWVAHLKKKS